MISEAQEQDGKGDNMNSDMISISALTAVITALLPAFKIFSSYDKRIALLEHQTMALLVKQEKTDAELDMINKTLNQHTVILERIETNLDFLKNK